MKFLTLVAAVLQQLFCFFLSQLHFGSSLLFSESFWKMLKAWMVLLRVTVPLRLPAVGLQASTYV